MTGLAGKVEDERLSLDQVAETMFIAHVADVDADAVLVPGEIESVAAVFRDQRVEHCDPRAVVGEAAG